MSGRRYLHCISRIECVPCTFSGVEGRNSGRDTSLMLLRSDLGLLDSKVLSRNASGSGL